MISREQSRIIVLEQTMPFLDTDQQKMIGFTSTYLILTKFLLYSFFYPRVPLELALCFVQSSDSLLGLCNYLKFSPNFLIAFLSKLRRAFQAVLIQFF
jgi:hypothetical protein